MNLEFNKRLEKAAAFVEEQGYHPVYIALFGAQNYELDIHTDEYQSDFDFKCIVLPTLAEMIKNSKPTSVVLDYEGGHIDVKDIREYMKVVTKANPSYIEPLITPHCMPLNEGKYYMVDICSKAQRLVSEEGFIFISACKGLFYEKKTRMSHPFPTKMELINKYGYDGKQVSHALRMLLVLKSFGATGKYNLVPPKEFVKQLIDLKMNKYTIDEAKTLLEGWQVELEHLCADLSKIYRQQDSFKFEAAEEMMLYAQRMVFDFCQTQTGKGENLLFDT